MVLTVHDLIPLEIAPAAPETRSWARRVGAAARKARRLITPSAYSKRQLVERLGLPAKKITVNPWAPDGNVRRVTEPYELDRVRRKYGLPPDESYVLGFGADDPRKNTGRILEAWASMPRALREKHSLLLVGIKEPALSRFRGQARTLFDRDRVLLHGFAAEADLPALLSGSTALCYPSLTEGFGLPILDAFVCETPVLTSDATSLPEVAGDAAVLVDPKQPTSIRDGLVRLLEDEGLRRELVARGRERLQHYTWERCAECLAGVLEQAA
jgi:alpha-1,3-rhamnosyl/mannosyltransferase